MTKHPNHIKKQLKSLGNRIRQIRKEKGYSNYEQFAYSHELNRSSYGRFETGGDLRFSSLLKVLKAFDMSIEEFFSEGFGEEEEQNKELNK